MRLGNKTYLGGHTTGRFASQRSMRLSRRKEDLAAADRPKSLSELWRKEYYAKLIADREAQAKRDNED